MGAKLGVASEAEAREFGVLDDHYHDAWHALLNCNSMSHLSPDSAMRATSLQVVGLAFALAGAEAATPRFRDLLATSPQLLTGLQCLNAFSGRQESCSRPEAQRLLAVLEFAEPLVGSRSQKTRREGGANEASVLDTLEALCSHPSRMPEGIPLGPHGIPLIRVEQPVAQYFLDIALLQPPASSQPIK